MQMKLGKLLAETKTGEKRQIEPEKDGRGSKVLNLNWRGIIFL